MLKLATGEVGNYFLNHASQLDLKHEIICIGIFLCILIIIILIILDILIILILIIIIVFSTIIISYYYAIIQNYIAVIIILDTNTSITIFIIISLLFKN